MIGKIVICLLGVLAFTNAQKVRTLVDESFTCVSYKSIPVLCCFLGFLTPSLCCAMCAEDMNENLKARQHRSLLRARVVDSSN